jgi:hypothetical protein
MDIWGPVMVFGIRVRWSVVRDRGYFERLRPWP